MPAFYKITISRKTKSFGTFCLLFLDIMDLWHHQSKYSNKFIEKYSMQILICSLLQPKYLVITQEKKRASKDGAFLSFTTEWKCRATYNLNIKAIFFAIMRGCHSSQLI